MEERHARMPREEMPARVRQVNILIAFFCHWAEVHHAALAVVQHVAPLGYELRA